MRTSILLFLLSALSLPAATLQKTFGFTSTLTGGALNQNVLIDQFDPILGILESVNLSLFSSLSATGVVQHFQCVTPGSCLFSWNISGSTTVLAPSAALEQTLTFSQPGGGIGPPGSRSYSISNPQSGNSSSSSPPDSLAAYIGTNQWTLNVSTTGTSSGVTSMTQSMNGIVTYTYTPDAGIPEPSTILLMASSLGLVGWYRRRSR